MLGDFLMVIGLVSQGHTLLPEHPAPLPVDVQASLDGMGGGLLAEDEALSRYPHVIPPDVSVYADGARPPAVGDVPHTAGPIVQAVCPTVWACVLSHLLWDAHPAPAEAPPGRPCCARP